MFDWKKPTVQMLGRWQPWHNGLRELFKRSDICINLVGILFEKKKGNSFKNIHSISPISLII